MNDLQQRNSTYINKANLASALKYLLKVMKQIIPDQQWRDVLLLLVYYVGLYLDVLLQMINMVCSLITYTKGIFLKVHFLYFFFKKGK